MVGVGEVDSTAPEGLREFFELAEYELAEAEFDLYDFCMKMDYDCKMTPDGLECRAYDDVVDAMCEDVWEEVESDLWDYEDYCDHLEEDPECDWDDDWDGGDRT